MRTTLHNRTPSGGFTAIDLIATLGIIALAVAVAMPAAVSTLRSYRRNLAAWGLTTELRRVQSLAVSRGESFVLQWADGANGAYRIVRDEDGHCSLPANDAPVDGVRVVRSWTRLDDQFSGIRLSAIEDGSGRSLAGVGFASSGTASGACSAAAFPILLEVSDRDGKTETIEVRRSGLTRRR